jgi:hypothetical protein
MEPADLTATSPAHATSPAQPAASAPQAGPTPLVVGLDEKPQPIPSPHAYAGCPLANGTASPELIDKAIEKLVDMCIDKSISYTEGQVRALIVGFNPHLDKDALFNARFPAIYQRLMGVHTERLRAQLAALEDDQPLNTMHIRQMDDHLETGPKTRAKVEALVRQAVHHIGITATLQQVKDYIDTCTDTTIPPQALSQLVARAHYVVITDLTAQASGQPPTGLS